MTTSFPTSSRRKFLQGSASAAIAGGLLLDLPVGAYAATNEKLKIGLIGCGGRGTGAAVNALNADANTCIYALADAFDDRLQASLKALKSERSDRVEVTPDRCFTGFDAYKKVIECCDVVLLCTPPGFRPLHLRAAIEAGKHVFCEKPLAVDGPGVRSVIESAQLAQKKGLSLVSGFCYRYDIPKREMIARIHDGAIGDVVAIQSSYNTGTIWHRGADPKWSEMEYQMRNWYYFTWLSGDFIVEQHIHNLDKAAWVLRDTYPIAATGLGGRQVRTDAKYGNIWDHFSVVFEYEKGQRVFSYCRQMANCLNDVSDHILGTKGRAELQSHTIQGDKPWRWSGKDAPNMYDLEHGELFRAIRTGKPLNDGEAAAYSTLMGIMGRMAAYTGKRVTWKQALTSKEDLTPSSYEWGPLPMKPIAMPGITKLI